MIKDITGKDMLDVITENNNVQLFRGKDGLWVVKSFFGNLFYDDEELAEELENNWENAIIL